MSDLPAVRLPIDRPLREPILIDMNRPSKVFEKQNPFRNNLENRTPKRRGPGMVMALFAAMAVVLVAMVVGYLHFATDKKEQTIHLYNALGSPYTISIDGRVYNVEPDTPMPITASAGSHTVTVDGTPFEIREETIRIDVPAGRSSTRRPVYVLNPDRLAVMRVQIERLSGGAAIESPKAIIDSSFQRFDDLDFAFEQFPEEDDVTSRARKTPRRRLDVFSALRHPGSLLHIAYVERNNSVANVIRRLLELNPGQLESLALGKDFLPKEEFEAVLARALAIRPIQLEVHRFFAGYAAQHLPARDLQKEYRDQLATEPGNGDLMFLLSGLTVRDESMDLLRRSAGAPTPCPAAAVRLANRYMEMGDFTEAIGYAEQAIAAMPTDRAALAAWRAASMANGRFDAVIEDAARRVASAPPPDDYSNAALAVELLSRAGNSFEAQTIVDRYVASTKSKLFRQSDFLKVLILRGEGRLQDYLVGMGELNDGVRGVHEWLDLGNVEKAAELLKESSEGGPVDYLLTYSVASRMGAAVLAKDILRLGLEELDSASGAHNGEIAAILRAPQPPALADLVEIEIDLNDRRALLLVLGTYFPQESERFFAAARKLNFDPTSPLYYILKRSAGEAPE